MDNLWITFNLTPFFSILSLCCKYCAKCLIHKAFLAFMAPLANPARWRHGRLGSTLATQVGRAWATGGYSVICIYLPTQIWFFTLVTSPYINTAFNTPQPKLLSCFFFSFDVSCNRCCHALLLIAMPMSSQTTQPQQGPLQPLQPLKTTQPMPPYSDACTGALKPWFLSRAC